MAIRISKIFVLLLLPSSSYGRLDFLYRSPSISMYGLTSIRKSSNLALSNLVSVMSTPLRSAPRSRGTPIIEAIANWMFSPRQMRYGGVEASFSRLYDGIGRRTIQGKGNARKD